MPLSSTFPSGLYTHDDCGSLPHFLSTDYGRQPGCPYHAVSINVLSLFLPVRYQNSCETFCLRTFVPSNLVPSAISSMKNWSPTHLVLMDFLVGSICLFGPNVRRPKAFGTKCATAIRTYLCIWDHPFKTSACLKGEGCPHVPMVKRSQYIRINNPLQKYFPGMPMVGG